MLSPGRLIYETKTIDGISHAVSYTYTASGIPASITYPSGRTVNYGLDQNSRVSSVSAEANGATKDVIRSIAYTTGGMVSELIYGNGIVTTKGYDIKGALNSINIGNLKSLSYTRDNVGNITSIMDNLDSSRTKTYAYDAIYRLTEADCPWGTMQYTYDPVGNRKKETTDGGVTDYAYGPANKLMSSAGVKAYNFGYDTNGNTVSEGPPLKADRSENGLWGRCVPSVILIDISHPLS